jgi:cytochrome o ubiquinol oxidase operon protein cyoD
MHDNLSLKQIQKEWHGTITSYGIGFTLCLLLSLLSCYLVIEKVISPPMLTYVLMGLALLQSIIQFIFFLHVGKEPKPKWESLVFYFMVMVLLIIVFGTLWIMNDLNERTMKNMPQMEMNHD